MTTVTIYRITRRLDGVADRWHACGVDRFTHVDAAREHLAYLRRTCRTSRAVDGRPEFWEYRIEYRTPHVSKSWRVLREA